MATDSEVELQTSIAVCVHTMATKQLEETLLTTDLLLHRLHSGLGIAGGARGSLTKAASKRSVTDLQLQQIEITKLLLTSQRNATEVAQLENAQQQQQPTVVPTVKTIPELRSELGRLEQVQSCLEEYEALAKLTVGRHTVSEHKLQQDIQELESQHARALQELHQLTAAGRVRHAQFHALQHCLQDLQQSLQEQPLTLQPHELEQTAAASNDEDESMDMEEEETKQPVQEHVEDDEGELLYGDL